MSLPAVKPYATFVEEQSQHHASPVLLTALIVKLQKAIDQAIAEAGQRCIKMRDLEIHCRESWIPTCAEARVLVAHYAAAGWRLSIERLQLTKHANGPSFHGIPQPIRVPDGDPFTLFTLTAL